MNVVGIVPARYASVRFPAKALASIAGRTMIARVVGRALAARKLDLVVVATDHDEIARAAEEAGAKAILTDPSLPSGTDRVAEVARGIDCGWVINIQGDEPLLPSENIDLVAGHMSAHPELPMATLRTRIVRDEDRSNPNVVKVVTDVAGRALYFGRSPLPYFRNPGAAWKHIGLYGYRRDFLLKFASMPPTSLERTEGLEQLRALENGFPIAVLETSLDSPAVDAPEDVAKVEELIRVAEGAEPGSARVSRKP